MDVRGGGTGSREMEGLSPLANAEGPTAVLLTGGSAFGLAAADGVAQWLEERGLGRPTPAGPKPLVPAAVVFDLVVGESSVRPGPEGGYAACDSAAAGLPARGSLGAGSGAAVGKLLGRDRATRGGVGYAARALTSGEIVAAIAVANGFGDVVARGRQLLGAPRNKRGEFVRTAELVPEMPEPPDVSIHAGGNTTLVCVCTDASLDKRGCAIVARMATAGIARRSRPRLHSRGRRCDLLLGVRITAAGASRTGGDVGADRARWARRNRHGRGNPGRRASSHARPGLKAAERLLAGGTNIEPQGACAQVIAERAPDVASEYVSAHVSTSCGKAKATVMKAVVRGL